MKGIEPRGYHIEPRGADKPPSTWLFFREFSLPFLRCAAPGAEGRRPEVEAPVFDVHKISYADFNLG